ncbi:IclR family transcriptional regulator [Alteribacillus sp. JSM 102045]|uniref:IclR family transcriptional regulator n=1 Tax=Alteribacillus sp. JSM 102045 TaxID=1562101 RepID=UPI0035C0BDA5
MEYAKKEFKKTEMIQSLQVGLSIIEVISKKNRPLKYNDIFKELSLSKNNLYKYLNTLTALGMLYRNPFTGEYYMGPKLAEYGFQAVDQENVIEQITPYLKQLRDETNETVLYACATERGPLVVKMLHNKQTLNVGAQIGTLLPLFSSTGKLAYTYPNEIMENWASEEFQKLEKPQQEELKENKKQIEKYRVAFASEPITPSVSSLAVPILDFNQAIVGTVTVVGFSHRIPTTLEDPMTQFIIEKGKEMSAFLDGSYT